MGTLLEAHHIQKYYDDFHVLKDVGLVVPKACVFGLLGPNGAGKTTLIRILTGINLPDKGEVLYNGSAFTNETPLSIGYLPEERGLYRKMKVWEQAMYLCRIKGISKARAEISLTDWFTRLNMMSWKNRRVEELSKGMQQKLQFVITVAHDPLLLILDEPFSGFDPVNAEEIKREILRLNDEGTTIVFSTHNMASVEEICDHIALIHHGENVLHGPIDEVRKSFSKSKFEVEFKGSNVAFANALGYQYEIDHISETPVSVKATIRAHGDVGANPLLQSLINHVEVVAFRELIPSMHDIFLEQVSTTPKTAGKP